MFYYKCHKRHHLKISVCKISQHELTLTLLIPEMLPNFNTILEVACLLSVEEFKLFVFLFNLLTVISDRTLEK